MNKKNIFSQDCENIIGRDAEIKSIEDAIGQPTSSIFYVVGEGGYGKTRLLRCILEKTKQRNTIDGATKVLETGVIDLYQSRYLHPVLLMQAIVRRLRASLKRHVPEDQPTNYFQNYESQLNTYILRLNNPDPDTGNTMAQISQTFIEDYNQLAHKYPIVCFLDTFEKLHPSIAEVEEYNFRPERRLERWLADLIGRLDQTTVVLAGRYREEQERLLPPLARAPIQLKTFDEGQTRAYVRSIAAPFEQESDRI